MGQINFNDYISEDERREIAREVFRDYCTKIANDKSERVLSNSAYSVVTQMVNDQMDGKLEIIIRDKAIALIGELSVYTAFKSPDYWNGSSKGYDILQDALEANQQKAKDKIASLIDCLDAEEVTEMLKDRACEMLDEKLFGKGSKNA